MQHTVLEILIVLAASLAAVWVVGRAKLPSIVGYLAAGIVIGPNGLRFVRDPHLIEGMAEVGVVLLMFTIGLKFSVAELARMRSVVFGAGAAQVVLTIAACAGLGVLVGVPVNRGAFIGFLVAMSSTAIVMKLLEEKAETDSAHGRLVTGILIFQDLAVVPLMLATPMLAGGGESLGAATRDLLKSLAMVGVILVVARFVLPRFFGVVARTRSREVFTLATMLVILATAAASGAAGLSLALGALIAGVVLSESDYASQVLSDVVPLRDLLASLFFVSVGMLVNVRDWIDSPLTTVATTAVILALNCVIVWGIARAFGLGPRVSVLAGLAIAQIGEFSFILAASGLKLHLLDDSLYRQFLSASVLTMALTPFLLMLGPWLTRASSAVPVAHAGEGHATRRDHVVIVGYGVTGRNAASALKPLGANVVILELNPHTVRAVRAAGGDAEYGDACSMEVLQHVGIPTARALVLTALDPIATRRTVELARSLNPTLEIVVRTRYVAEMAELHRLGATAVVPEEFEASIALAGVVMKRFGASDQAVARAAAALRGDDYSLLSTKTSDTTRAASLARCLSATEFANVTVPASAAGRTLRDLDLRAVTGANVIGVERGGGLVGNPDADFALAAGDILVVLAPPASVRKVHQLLA